MSSKVVDKQEMLGWVHFYGLPKYFNIVTFFIDWQFLVPNSDTLELLDIYIYIYFDIFHSIFISFCVVVDVVFFFR